MHSDTIWNNVLVVGTAENILISLWINLNQCFGSGNCWENVESEYANWGILALFVTMVLFTLQLLRKLYKQRCWMVYSKAIWNNVFEVWKLKTRTLNSAFSIYLKLCFGTCSLNCWENFEIILMWFESIFWKWELVRQFWNQGC